MKKLFLLLVTMLLLTGCLSNPHGETSGEITNIEINNSNTHSTITLDGIKYNMRTPVVKNLSIGTKVKISYSYELYVMDYTIIGEDEFNDGE